MVILKYLGIGLLAAAALILVSKVVLQFCLRKKTSYWEKDEIKEERKMLETAGLPTEDIEKTGAGEFRVGPFVKSERRKSQSVAAGNAKAKRNSKKNNASAKTRQSKSTKSKAPGTKSRSGKNYGATKRSSTTQKSKKKRGKGAKA